MYGVSIDDDYPSHRRSPSEHNDAILQNFTVDNDASSDYLHSPITPDPSPLQVEHAVNNDDLKNRIERMHMRSKGQYAPQRDRDDLHVPAPPLGLDASCNSHQHQRDLHGPFAVPSAAACRRHRHKSYGKCMT